MSRIVGIDLGTTYSLASLVHGRRPEIVTSDGERLLPSVVGISPQGGMLVGTPARNQLVSEPENTVRSIKRRMGTNERVKLGRNTHTPPEVSAFILRELKRRTETHLGEPVERAVITVPAYFTDAQRQATRDAGEIAGFAVERIINEPTAAALAYGVDREEEQFLLVYDLGGGTFDVSVIEQVGGVLEVRSSHGDTQLGGDDFDRLLADWAMDEFKKEHKTDLRKDARAAARVLRAAEHAKIELSDRPYARITEEFIAQKGRAPLHLDLQVSREQLEEMILPLVDRTQDLVALALRDAGLEPDDLDKVLLVGGSTRIPMVRERVEDQLALEAHAEIHPDEAVALGAAVQAAIIEGHPIETILVDVAPHSLGIETVAVHLGGIDEDVYSVLIPRNSTVPCSKADHFFTMYPEQDTVRIKAYQGEEDVASHNTLLGDFLLSNIAPSPDPRAQREVIVQFDYDVDGIVQVSALDPRSGKREGVTVKALRDGMTAEEKEAARERVAGPVAIAPGSELQVLAQEVEVLLERARKLEAQSAEREELETLEPLRRLMGEVEAASAAGDAQETEDRMAALLDLLYKHEEA